MSTAEDPAPEPRFGMLRTIALYKLVKVLLLLLVAYGELRLHDASLSAKCCPGPRHGPRAWSTRW